LVAHPTARKWVITPVINGISKVNPLITGVITHLLSGMSHQVVLIGKIIYALKQRMMEEFPHGFSECQIHRLQ